MRCANIINDDQQCNAWALKGSNLCFSHDPASKMAKHRAVVSGGLVRSRGKSHVIMHLDPLNIKTPKDVVSLLEDTINNLRRLPINASEANSIGYLANTLLKAFDVAGAHKDDQGALGADILYSEHGKLLIQAFKNYGFIKEDNIIDQP